MNTASENRIKKLHPELASRVRALIEQLGANGIQVEIVQGLRTFAEQDALFAQGRTKKGLVVTNARGGQSNHNYGLAADLCPFNDGKPNWNAPGSIWVAIGAEAEKLGLQWGGNWKKFIDKPHVQLPSPDVKQCLALFKKGGLAAVWEETSRGLGVTPPAATATSTTTTPTTPTPTEPLPERLLSRGDSGEGVRMIQARLAALGLIAAKGVDGIFGAGTFAAVKKFQASKGLKADGKVGPMTRQALMS